VGGPLRLAPIGARRGAQLAYRSRWLGERHFGILPFPEPFGTIGLVKDHRIRLTDEDIDLVVAALTARVAMLSGKRAHRAWRLIGRLTEGGVGNPRWRIDEQQQAREDQFIRSGAFR